MRASVKELQEQNDALSRCVSSFQLENEKLKEIIQLYENYIALCFEDKPLRS